jgi:hypothetical protein
MRGHGFLRLDLRVSDAPTTRIEGCESITVASARGEGARRRIPLSPRIVKLDHQKLSTTFVKPATSAPMRPLKGS